VIEGNGYSLIKINNEAYNPFKLALREFISELITAQNLLNIEQLYVNNFYCSKFANVTLSEPIN